MNLFLNVESSFKKDENEIILYRKRDISSLLKNLIIVIYHLITFTKSKKIDDNILKQWKSLEYKYSLLCKMTRDHLTISTTKVNCERVFNIAKALYNHRKSYNLTIFFAIIMIWFHDQKKNLQAKLDVDLSLEEKMINKNRDKEMQKRENELQNVYNERYINDEKNEDENNITSNTSTQKVTTIRWLNFILCYKKIFNLKQKSKKRNFDAKKFISTQQKATSKRIASSQSETTS